MKVILNLLVIIGCSCGLINKSESASLKHADVIKQDDDKSNDLILWGSDVVLTWDDFQGTPNYDKSYKALSYTKIRMIPIDNSDDSLVYDITNSFIRSKSWAKDKLSVSLLKHEQLHFDITEIVVRKIRKEFSLLDLNLVQNDYSILSNIFRSFSVDFDKEINDRYDNETKLGTLEIEQQRWNEWVKNELEVLKEYESRLVVIRKD